MRSGPALAAAATALFAVFGTLRYFGSVLAAPAWAAALLMLVVGIAGGLGRKAVISAGLGTLPESEKTLAGISLGLGMLSLAVFTLCAVHRFTPAAVSGVLAFFFILGYGELRRGMAAHWKALMPLKPLEHPIAAAGIALALGLMFWACWVPPHQYDALVYHLTLPQAYIREGGFLAVPHLLFSHFPQNGEMLFGLALIWKCDVLAQYFVWLATALCAGWVLAASAEETPAGTRFLAAFLLATHTALMLLSSVAYVEAFVMLWLSAAFFSMLRFQKDGLRGSLVLSAAFTGLALGTKYYAGIGAVVLAGGLARRRRWRELGLYVGITSAVFAPWLIKNWVMVGNPIFPFLYQCFPLSRTGWSAAAAHGYFQIMVEYGHTGNYLHDFLSLPKLLLSNSLRYGGGMDVLGDLGWDLSLWCLPLAAWAAASDRFLRRLLGFCLAYGALWFLTGVVLRFLTVIAPVLCLLAAGGLGRLWRALPRSGRCALAFGVAALTLTHLALFGYVHAVFGSERFLLGLEGREEFLAKRLDYYPCAVFARERLPANDKILIVGEQRSYYVKQGNMATTVNAPNRFIEWSNGAEGPAALAARLRREGFSHVLVVPSEARRLGPGLGSFTEEGRKNWEGLDPSYLKTEFKGPACVVFGLEPPRL